MFTIDLLDGRRIPFRMHPVKVGFMAVPFVIPVLLVAYMAFQIQYNNIAIADSKAEIAGMEDSITLNAKAMSEYSHNKYQLALIQEDLDEISSVLSRHQQFSDIIKEIAVNMPDSIMLLMMDLKRNASRERISTSDSQILYKTNIERELIIRVFGPINNETDQIVEQYLSRLRQSDILKPVMEDIRIVSKEVEEIEDVRQSVFEIECVMKVKD